MAIPTQAEARRLLADLVPNYYLIENRRRIRRVGGQYATRRRVAPWGTRGPIPQGQLHSYEAPHTRSLIAAAEYIVTRTGPGSYHGLAGDDDPRDVLPMAPVTCETWHCIPSNPWSIGWSCVMYANSWRKIPARSRTNLVKSLAFGFYLSSLELIALGKSPIPAKRITRAEAMRGVWGFNMHRHMDPGRRTDIAHPESDFPWDEFFAEYTRLLEGDTPSTAIPKGYFDMSMSPNEFNRHISRHAENVHRGVQRDLNRLVVPQLENLAKALAAVAGGERLDEEKLRDGVQKSAEQGALAGTLAATDVFREALIEVLAEQPDRDADALADAVVDRIASRLGGGTDG